MFPSRFPKPWKYFCFYFGRDHKGRAIRSRFFSWWKNQEKRAPLLSLTRVFYFITQFAIPTQKESLLVTHVAEIPPPSEW